jgi:hypothetical protein
VVYPVHTLSVDQRQEHLIIGRRFQLWNNRLKTSLLPSKMRTANHSDCCLLQRPALKVKQAVRISVPEEALNFQLVVYRFHLFNFARD